jgi:hypothetical protein
MVAPPNLPPPITLKEPPTPANKQRSQDIEDEEEKEQQANENVEQASISANNVASTSQLSAPIILPQTSPLYTSGDLNTFLPFIQPNLLEFQQNCMQIAALQRSLHGTPVILSPSLNFQHQIMMNAARSAESTNMPATNPEMSEPQNPIERSILEHQAIVKQEPVQSNTEFAYSMPVDLSAVAARIPMSSTQGSVCEKQAR